jgi:hypothetical protein
MGSSWILLPGPLPQSSSPRLDPRGNHDVSICKEAPCEDWSDKKRHIRKKTPGDYDLYIYIYTHIIDGSIHINKHLL